MEGNEEEKVLIFFEKFFHPFGRTIDNFIASAFRSLRATASDAYGSRIKTDRKE